MVYNTIMGVTPDPDGRHEFTLKSSFRLLISKSDRICIEYLSESSPNRRFYSIFLLNSKVSKPSDWSFYSLRLVTMVGEDFPVTSDVVLSVNREWAGVSCTLSPTCASLLSRKVEGRHPRPRLLAPTQV